MNGSELQYLENWTSGGYTPDIDGVDGLGFIPGWSSSAIDLVSEGTIVGLTPGDFLTILFVAGWDSSVFAGDPAWTLSEVDLSNVVPIPEPSVAVLGGVFSFALLARRRRY